MKKSQISIIDRTYDAASRTNTQILKDNKTWEDQPHASSKLWVLPFMPAFVLVFSFFCLSFPSYVFPWSKVNIRRIWRILNPEQNKHEVNDEIQPEIQRYLRSLRNTVSSIVGVETCSPIYAIMEKRVSVSRSKGSGYEKRSNDSPSTPDTERSSF